MERNRGRATALEVEATRAMAAPLLVSFVEQNGQRYYTLFACVVVRLSMRIVMSHNKILIINYLSRAVAISHQYTIIIYLYIP